MQQSNNTRSRAVINRLESGNAKIRAGDLWAEDLGNWVVLMMSDKVVKGVLQRYCAELRSQNGSPEVTIVLSKSSGQLKDEQNRTPYYVRANTEVWICVGEPTLSVRGITVKDEVL